MENGELRYYHSSQNNSRFCYVPHLIRTEEDFENFLDELQGQDIGAYSPTETGYEMSRSFADRLVQELSFQTIF
jgi:uncharacterized protein YpbB